MSDSNLQAFVSKSRFYTLLGVCFATGERYLSRKVLEPSAILDGNQSIFEHSGESLSKAHTAIREYRSQLRLTRYNLKTTN